MAPLISERARRAGLEVPVEVAVLSVTTNDLAAGHGYRLRIGVLASADGRTALEELLNRVFAVSRFQRAERRAALDHWALVVNATLRVLPKAGFNPLPNLLFFVGGRVGRSAHVLHSTARLSPCPVQINCIKNCINRFASREPIFQNALFYWRARWDSNPGPSA